LLDCNLSFQEYKNDMENSTQTLGAELTKVNEEKNVSKNTLIILWAILPRLMLVLSMYKLDTFQDGDRELKRLDTVNFIMYHSLPETQTFLTNFVMFC
jgi:hypothetical protein